MKTLVVYTSQTGFTKKYSQWLADKMSADIYDLKDAKKKGASFFEQYDAIVYAGWIMAGKVVKLNWFLSKAENLKNKLEERNCFSLPSCSATCFLWRVRR